MADMKATLERAKRYLGEGRPMDASKLLRGLYQQASENQELLALLAKAELAQQRFASALPVLYELLRLNPSEKEVREHIRLIHKRLVGAWHYEMMNDEGRNDAFEAAIKATVKDKVVFEIGTGSGLLAMMAARAGAKHVYTCEQLLPVAKAAQQIIEQNGYSDRITLFHKNSTAVELGKDIPEKADVLIAEILGPGVVEEQAATFIGDVRTRLIKDSAPVIPARVDCFACLVESEHLFQKIRVHEVSGFDLSRFNSIYDQPMLEEQLAWLPHERLSEAVHFATLDFAVEQEVISGKKIDFAFNKGGTCHGIALWFRLFTDKQNSLETGPDSESSHWRQLIQIFDKPLVAQTGQILECELFERKTRYFFEPKSLKSKKNS